eukprot:TRINITY_DN18377_c0_g1_i2.p1 TRINITY_DN18377_c0_g1~~TRINITY_DN18377_c0_g1_i2.p1  ORF type:complete len:507 (-),score=95.85 TRINITY_DN18377_c0_g1_i2:184-1626(-)
MAVSASSPKRRHCQRTNLVVRRPLFLQKQRLSSRGRRLLLCQRLRSKEKKLRRLRCPPQAESAAEPLAEHEVQSSAPETGLAATKTNETDTVRRNIALEAVRVGNYFAEPSEQDAVLAYIKEQFDGLLEDKKFLAKNRRKLATENGFTKRYTLEEILAKKHEADGFDVFVDPDEAIAAAERVASGPREGPAELDPGMLGELRDSLMTVVASKDGTGDLLVDAEEVVELLEGCAKAGETAASVFCGEYLHEIHDDKLPESLVDRVFNALKPLLRPSARQSTPRLEGPWSTHASSNKSLNSKLGRLLDKLSQARREQAIAGGGSVAELAERATEAKRVLSRLCDTLLPLLGADSEAKACRRRGPLVAAVTRVCGEHNVRINYSLSWLILLELESRGHVVVRGREVELAEGVSMAAASAPVPAVSAETRPVASSSDGDGNAFGLSATDLSLLEQLSRESLERRNKRKKSREKARDAKRCRIGD